MLKCVLNILFISLVSKAYGSEGFFVQSISLAKSSRAIVKIDTKLKIRFNAVSPKPPFIDEKGFAVWEISQTQANVNEANCRQDHFKFYPYFKEACQALKQNASLKNPIPVEHAATGEVISTNGFILTAAHLVSNCVLFSSGKYPYRCPLLEVRDHYGNSFSEVDVYFIGQAKNQDFAILKINRKFTTYIQLRNLVPKTESYAALGFPMVSKRPPTSLQKYNYTNADGKMRISYGKPIAWSDLSLEAYRRAMAEGFHPNDYILSDIDVIPGNSGGAFFDKYGDLAGITNGILDGKGPMQTNPVTQFMASSKNPIMILTTESICNSIAAIPSLFQLNFCQ